jgi:argininosuccinate lyase
VGQLVQQAEKKGVSLARLPLKDLRAASPLFGEGVSGVFDFDRAVARRKATGGTAPDAVRRQIALAKERLSNRAQ